MKNLFTKTLLLGGLAGSLALGGCGDNKNKYKDIIKLFKSAGYDKTMNTISFNYNKKDFKLEFNEEETFLDLNVTYGIQEENFIDDNCNGLDRYTLKFDERTRLRHPFGILKEGFKTKSEEYDSLITNIPKWYAESKKISSVEKQLTELEKFNLENKRVYEDFFEFVEKTKAYVPYASGGGFYEDEIDYKGKYKGQKLRIHFHKGTLKETLGLHLMINFLKSNWESWKDRGADGTIEKYGKESLGKGEKELNEFSPEKQLEIHKNCANIYKEIMREKKFKNY